MKRTDPQSGCHVAARLANLLCGVGSVLFLIAIWIFSPGKAFAGALAPFTFVMINSDTERLYGSLPFNRALVARAVESLTAAKAKGVILKFFYDLPSTEENDSLLERSICASSVALQAGLNDDEGTTGPLESKFQFEGPRFAVLLPLFSGDKALLPLERFRRCASAVGFVDSTESQVPLFELYQGKLVKSLQLVALEMVSNQTAQADGAGFVKLGSARLELMHEIVFPATNSISYIPFHDVLSQEPSSWRTKVEGSVVVLGYDGKNIHTINTPLGAVGAHRFFIYGLLSLAQAYEKAGQQR